MHCVIIGFSEKNNRTKILFNNDSKQFVSSISPYLTEGDMIFVGRANSPLAPVESITKGCQPTDGGNLIIEEEDYEEFINQEPQAQKYIKRLYGAVEFINNKKRYCLWLKGISPAKLRQMPKVLERVQKVKEMRLNSSATGTRKLSERPHEFRETYNFDSYILIPSTSSENRRYIPIGFMGKDDISTNANLIIPDASLFHFGILTSNVHMAWMRTVAGRLEMRYRYSAKIVYNNFPWPEVTEAQKEKISKTAQAILDARALYPDSSLADLYDELTMPAELRQAHQANDKAVMEVYGMKKIVDGKKTWLTESETVARLFEMYEEITKTK